MLLAWISTKGLDVVVADGKLHAESELGNGDLLTIKVTEDEPAVVVSGLYYEPDPFTLPWFRFSPLTSRSRLVGRSP